MHAGIERAAARAHRQPVDRGEAHRARDAAPAGQRAHAGAVAEVQHHGLARARRARRRCGQHDGDVLVGQAVEAVAPHAAPRRAPAAARTSARRAGCVRWNAVSKQATCGSSGSALEQRADRREVVRLVQRRERDAASRARRRTAASTRTGVGVLARRRARRGGRPPTSRCSRQLRRAGSRRGARARPSWPSVAPVAPATSRRSTAPAGVLGDEARRRVDALDLAARDERERRRRAGEQRELDARRAGVEDERSRRSSVVRPTALSALSRRAWATSAATAHEASRVITESARLVRMIGTARRARCRPRRRRRGTTGSWRACCRPRGRARSARWRGPRPASRSS